MTPERTTRRNFWFNLDLVLKETKRWPVATTIVAAIICALVAVQAINEPRADATYFVVGVVGYLSGALGMKALLHLMAYTIRHKTSFPGSYLVACAIAMMPIFVFYACAFYILSVQQNEFPPPIQILLFLAFAYPLITAFFTGALHVQEWMQLSWQRVRTRMRPQKPPT